MGPRSTNQPSILIRIVGLISVLATVVAIYYLIGDSDVADNIDGTQYGRHPSHGPILQPIEISQPSSHLPLTSYTCMPSANLSHIPTTQPLMGLPFPLPKYFHQHGHSIAVRLALTAPYSLVLDLTRQEISNSTKSLVNTASRRFCLAQKAPSSRVDAYYHDVGTIKVILSSAAMLDVAAKSSLSKKLLRKVQHPEAYCLLIKEDNRAIVIAHNERGAMLALETLSQLLHSPMGLQVPTEIIDWPENSWRGLLVDVARHFQPIPILHRIIDGMQASKLNTLHLHLTDAQSFPVLLNDTLLDLNLTRLVVNSPLFAAQRFYTLQDLHDLVLYANERGIEVVPELDVPAHTFSWGNALSDLVLRCDRAASYADTPLNIYPLDITNELVYTVIEAILRQLAAVFPSKYLHIGGDEVDMRCWQESPHVRAYMREKHFTHARELSRYFETRVFDMVYRLRKTPIVWQGVVDTNSMPQYETPFQQSAVVTARGRLLTSEDFADRPADLLRRKLTEESISFNGSHPKAIVMPWKCWGGLALRSAHTALSAGHPVIMAACLYLDFNQDWLAFLRSNLLEDLRSEVNGTSESELLLGGQANLWTENVDATNAQCRVFPRLSGIAIRLWGLDRSLCMSSYLFNNSKLADLYAQPQEELPGRKIPPVDEETSCQLRGTSEDTIRLSPMSAKILYSAYVVHHNYLREHLGIQTEQLIFHLLFKNGGLTEYTPYYPTGLANALQIIQAMKVGISYPIDKKEVMDVPSLYPPHPLQSFLERYNLHADLFPGGNFSTVNEIYSGQRQYPIANILYNSIYLTSQCHGLPEYVQRPIQTSVVKIAQWNVADGVDLAGSPSRAIPSASSLLRTNLRYTIRNESYHLPASTVSATSPSLHRYQYLQTYLTALANEGYLAIGLNELVGWDGLASTTELYKNQPILVTRAMECGFVYQYMTSAKKFNGYPVGLLATKAFQVLREEGAPKFERGFLHAWFPSLELHIFVVHLHAHSSAARLAEVHVFIRENLEELLVRQAKVLVMGDFNSLSPVDRLEHERIDLLTTINSSDHKLLRMWQNKFLTSSRHEVDYRPMYEFYKAGMRDVCVDYCCRQASIDRCEDMTWSSPLPRMRFAPDGTNESRVDGGDTFSASADIADAEDKAGEGVPTASSTQESHLAKQEVFSLCMVRHCARSLPTHYAPEWPLKDVPSPAIRIDFILASPHTYGLFGANATAASSTNSSSNSRERQRESHFLAGVDMNNFTHLASDHYPMFVQFQDPDQPVFPLYQ